MRTRKLRWLAIGAAIFSLTYLTLIFALERPRSAVARTVFSALLETKGLRLTSGDLSLGGGRLEIHNLAIDERDNLPFLTATHISVSYALHGTKLSVSRVDLDTPHLVVRRAQDGSFNLRWIMGGGGGGSAGTQSNLHLGLNIRNGTIDFLNQYAPARSGRAFAVAKINGAAQIATGSISHGRLDAVLISAGHRRPIVASFIENDITRLAQLRASVRDLPLGPIMNYFISSTAFVIEDGAADALVHAYDVQWPDGTGPRWSISAKGFFYNGRLRVMPLIVPVRNLNGPFAFGSDVLALPGVSGVAAQLPVLAHGVIALQPSPWLDLRVATSGPLAKARALLAFLKPLPLRGELQVGARILGPPTDPRVGVAFSLPRGLSYARTPIDSASGMLVYYRGHVILPFVTASYEGFRVRMDGDIDVGSPRPFSGQLIAQMKGPAKNFPWIANIDDHGLLSARMALVGPLAQLRGDGFIQLAGRRGTIRTTFQGSPQSFTVGPLLALDPHGGSLWVAGSLDRTTNVADGKVIADHFSVGLNDRRTRLPGVFDTQYGMPATSGILDGTAVVQGPTNALLLGTALRARHIAFAGAHYGDADVSAIGSAQRKGVEQGLAAVRLRHASSAIAGIPLRAADLVVGIDRGKLRLYAGTARLAGGSIAASGDLSRGQRLPGSLVVAANRIQLGQIRPAGAPHFNGELTGIASTHRNRRAQQQLVLGGTARNLTISGRTMSVDADLGYNGRSVTSHDSRVLIDDGSAVNINGSVNTPSQTQLLAARLHLNATIRNGDIAQLAGAGYANAPVTGGVDANLRITGTLAQPHVAGELRSDVGTFRGVTYEDMRARVAATAGSVAIQGGHLAIGNSALDVSGVLAGNAADLRVASPYVDLSDFNDFFNGKDVFAGTGSLNVHVALTPGQHAGDGFASLRDVVIEHVPIGSLRASFTTPHRNVIAADITQRGSLANTHVVGTIAFPDVGSALALGHASYQARADLKNLDLSLLTPQLPSVSSGLRGKLSLLANVTGRPGHLFGFANFSLADGFIRKDRIEEFSGRVTSDGDELNLERFRTHIAGLDITGRGVYSAHRQIAAHVLISAPKLQDLERIAALPNAVQGAATLALDAWGTASTPRVHALLRASKGSAYGVGYERVNADADYTPGIIAVRDASVDLAPKHGTIALEGAVPIAFGPQPTHNGVVVDPPLAMALQLNGIGLDAFNPLIKDKASVEGRLDARATLTGSLNRPVFNGAAQIRGATVRSKLETVPLTNLNADVTASNRKIRLSKFHGKLGRGTVDVSGIVELRTHRRGRVIGRPVVNMRLVAQKANVSVPQLFSGVVNADVGIDTIRRQPLVAGTIVASDTDIPFSGIIALASGSSSGPPQAAQIPGVPPLRKGHVIAYGGQIYGPDVQFVHPTPRPHRIKRPRLPLALNLDVTAGDNVQVTGLVNATGTGTLHASGTLSSPQISGDIVAVRGDMSAFDTVFHLLRGDVAFSPGDGFLPTIQAQAIAYRPEADVTVTIDGRVDQMHTTIESDPPMSEQAILANILHINEINSALGGQSGQSLGAGASVGSLAGGLLTGKLLAAMNYGLERTLHIEEVNLAFNSNGQPTLEVRKNYGKNVYALYRTTLVAPPDNEVGMAYALRDALEVQFLEKQNTAGQTQWQRGQYTTFSVTYSLPQKQPKPRKHAPSIK